MCYDSLTLSRHGVLDCSTIPRRCGHKLAAMGKVGKRKGDLSSEACCLKNLLKYATYTSWNSYDNKVLLSALATLVSTNFMAPESGWLGHYFGAELCSDLVATQELLLMLAALLSGECKDTPALNNHLRHRETVCPRYESCCH